MSRASPANGADLSHEKIFTFQQHTTLIRLMASFRVA